VFAQTVSLMASPTRPQPFLRVFSAPAWRALLTRRSEFDTAVAQVRACPPGEPYGGVALIAFAADRGADSGWVMRPDVTRT
jgi:hypothetical protein